MELPKEGQLYAKPCKDGQLEEVLVKLTKEQLVVLRRDVVYEDIMANNDIVEEKVITLQRDKDFRLGFNIVGGIDYKSPIKIYKIIIGSPAQLCKELEELDIVLEVNGLSMWGRSHDEAGDIIRQSGHEVTLRTGKLKQRDVEGQVSVDKKWFKMIAVPLHMASITKYQPGTSILRPNSFEVTSRDGKSKVCLRCREDLTTGELEDWIGSITASIRTHNELEVEHYNNNFDRHKQIVRMDWVYEQLPSTIHANTWQRKFLVLKRMQIEIFDTIPDTIEEWERPESSYKLLEMTIKVLTPHTLQDQRANSLVLTSGTGTSHIISFETKENIMHWTNAIHCTTVEAVHIVKQISYAGKWKDRDVYFILDINQGILLSSQKDPSTIFWQKPFSYLQHSSDDGHSKLKLKCAIKQSKIPDIQDIQLDDLQLAICSLECFVAAKVAILDPEFIQQHTDLIAY